MASPVPPGAPRPGYYPPGYNPAAPANTLRPPNVPSPALGPPPSAPPSSAFSNALPALFPSDSPPHALSRPAPPALGPPQTALSQGTPLSRPPPPFPPAFASTPLASSHSFPPSSGGPSMLPRGTLPGPGMSSENPLSQPPPFGGALVQAAFTSTPLASHSLPPPSAHGPSMLPRGALPGAVIGSTTASHHPPIGPPPGAAPNARIPPLVGPPPTTSARGPLDPTGRPLLGPPPGGPSTQLSQPPPTFLAATQAVPSSPLSSYGSHAEQMQPAQGHLPHLGTMPPPRMYGMAPPLPGQAVPVVPPVMGSLPVSGAPTTGLSQVDVDQMPRPLPSSSIIFFETRQGGEANYPCPVPCTGDLLSVSCMQLALMVQPLALPHPSEEPIHVVDLGESGPVRCSRCKGYINPFMKFIDQGRRFICNLCGFTDETPRDYHCNLGPDGRRRDADERPELCRGTVEFVATKEFMIRDPMPAVFFFLVDVSMNAIQTGATAAVCSAISQAVANLPEGPRTMVGIATFDSTIHFYNLKRALQQPLMLIVPDVQDVYAPLQSDLIVQLSECRQHLEQLLENIPTMFQGSRVAESAFGAASKSCLRLGLEHFLQEKLLGELMPLLERRCELVSVLFSRHMIDQALGVTYIIVMYCDSAVTDSYAAPSLNQSGVEVQKLLQPADKTLKTMAAEFAEYQVCVDIFITCQTYVDIASISVVPRTTGGQVYYYYPFSAVSDSGKLYNDLRWNITRPQGFEAVMRVRCSQGLQVQEYSGNFCKRIPTDVDLPAIDCDKTIMVTFKHDDKFVAGSECTFQCALLYTTVYGQRRIRVSTLSLPCTASTCDLFRTADMETQFACILKQVANDIPTTPLIRVQEKTTDHCVDILHAYRKFCSTVSSSIQLLLPESLKLLPFYTLAVTKSVGMQNDGRLDDRSYWISRATSLPISLALPFVYPRMLAIHNLLLKEGDESLASATVPLSSDNLTDDGIFFIENGEDGLFYVGKEVNPDTVEQLFGAKLIEEIPLQQFDNELSKKLNNLMNEIRRERCSYLRLRFCKRGDPSGNLFLSYLTENKTPWGPSYSEFLVHIHRQIRMKMGL
ncbi:hypothetical protein Sjap_000925 [Stephania japonica]|uniref:Uncharacterized protein n=1 Tax=Stephania japonica TaxID=461633 RepID=A0AAP0PSV6_9MAGN